MQERIEIRDGQTFKVKTLPDDPRIAADSRQQAFGKLRKQRKPSKKRALRAAISRQKRVE